MVVGGIIIGYSYFGPTNSNLVSSLDISNLLGDWSDIHGVGLFNTADVTLYPLPIMVFIVNTKTLHGFKLEMINQISQVL